MYSIAALTVAETSIFFLYFNKFMIQSCCLTPALAITLLSLYGLNLSLYEAFKSHMEMTFPISSNKYLFS